MTDDIYTVTGYPIAHSMTPGLFKKYFPKKKFLSISADSLKRLNDSFNLISGAKTSSVTMPLKRESLDLPQRKSKNVIELNALNYLYNKGGIWTAENTDVYGALSYIKDEEDILIIGAGATAEVVVYALKDKKVNLFMQNRSKSKITELRKKYNYLQEYIDAKKYDMCYITIPESAISENHYELIRKCKKVVNINYGFSIIEKFCDAYQISYESGFRWLKTQFEHAYNISKPIDINRIDCKSDYDNLILVGISGVGKTILGRELSYKINYKLYDIDYEIEKNSGKSVKEIIENDGISYFRDLESRVLKNSLSSSEKKIVVSGAGIVEKNVNLLKEKGFVLWLNGDPEYIYNDIKNENTRPLIKDYNTFMNLYQSRISKYVDVADLLIHSDSFSELKQKLFYEVSHALKYHGLN